MRRTINEATSAKHSQRIPRKRSEKRLVIFLNEIQGKAFVIHLSFEDRNRFYIDCFSIVNVRDLYLSWPARS